MSSSFNWFNWSAGLVAPDFGTTPDTTTNWFYWTAGLVCRDKVYISTAVVVGATLTISGISFQPFSDSSAPTCTFNGTAFTPSSTSNTTIVASTSGMSQGTHTLVVTNDEGDSYTISLMVPYTSATLTIGFMNLSGESTQNTLTQSTTADTSAITARYYNYGDLIGARNFTSGKAVMSDANHSLIDSTITTLAGYGITDAAPLLHGVTQNAIPIGGNVGKTSWADSLLFQDSTTQLHYTGASLNIIGNNSGSGTLQLSPVSAIGGGGGAFLALLGSTSGSGIVRLATGTAVGGNLYLATAGVDQLTINQAGAISVAGALLTHTGNAFDILAGGDTGYSTRIGGGSAINDANGPYLSLKGGGVVDAILLATTNYAGAILDLRNGANDLKLTNAGLLTLSSDVVNNSTADFEVSALKSVNTGKAQIGLNNQAGSLLNAILYGTGAASAACGLNLSNLARITTNASTALLIDSQGAYPVVFGTNNTERARFDASGLTVAALAGVGDRVAIASATGVLSATTAFSSLALLTGLTTTIIPGFNGTNLENTPLSYNAYGVALGGATTTAEMPLKILGAINSNAAMNITVGSPLYGAYYELNNGGGSVRIGLEGAGGNSIFSGIGAAYAAVFGHTGNYPIQFVSNGVIGLQANQYGAYIGANPATADIQSFVTIASANHATAVLRISNSGKDATFDASNDATKSLYVQMRGSAVGGTMFGTTAAGLAVIYSDTISAMAIGTVTATSLILGTNNTASMRISSVGGVSIGTATDPGAGNLLVIGDIYSKVFTNYYSSSTITGFSSSTKGLINYQRIGRTVDVWIDLEGNSSSAITFTLPYKNNTGGTIYFYGYGTNAYGPSVMDNLRCSVADGATVVNIYDPVGICNFGTEGWPSSATKFFGHIRYYTTDAV